MLPSMERLTDFWLGILAKLWEWVRSSSPLKNHVKGPHFGLARKVRGTEISPGEVQPSTQLSHSPGRRVENALTKTICRFIFHVSDSVESTSHKRNCATFPSKCPTWLKISKALNYDNLLQRPFPTII